MISFQGGGFRLLGVQCVAVISISVWTIVVAFVFLKLIDLTIGLRLSLDHELLGADIVEHDIGDILYDKLKNRIVSINGQVLDDVTDGADDHNREDVKSRAAQHSKRKRRKFSDFPLRRSTINSSANPHDASINDKLHSPRVFRRFSTQSLCSDLSGHPRLRFRRGSSAFGKRIDSSIRSLEFLQESGIFHISDNHSGIVTAPNFTEAVTNVDEEENANHIISHDIDCGSRATVNCPDDTGGVLNDSFEMDVDQTDISVNKPIILENGIGKSLGKNAHNRPTIQINNAVIDPPRSFVHVNLTDVSTKL
jgi:hypothetical protein